MAAWGSGRYLSTPELQRPTSTALRVRHMQVYFSFGLGSRSEPSRQLTYCISGFADLMSSRSAGWFGDAPQALFDSLIFSFSFWPCARRSFSLRNQQPPDLHILRVLPLLESPIVKWRIGGLNWAGGCGLANAKNKYHLGGSAAAPMPGK